MNNKKQRNRLFTMLLLVMAILMPYGGAWAQTRPSKGDGKVGNPYIITKAEELKWFRDEVNRGRNNICAKISDEVDVIDMSTVCHVEDKSQNLEEKSWEPIGNTYNNSYEGTFDGNYKTITNLYINANQEYSGLFGYTGESTIKNLTFEYANVTNTGVFTGILVGYANTSTLQNIKISNTCQMKGGEDYTGGIAGKLLDGNAYNCVNYATVQGIEDVGGLFGFFAGTGNSITACANYGKVTASSQIAGGLVGDFYSGTIQDCANYGDVKGTERVAGMAGFVDKGKIQNVFSYGCISATNSTQEVGMAFGYSNLGATEGMVAYYSGAKLNANGQEITIKAFGNGKPSEDNATGFTEAQLKSGEVAWLLNGSTSTPAEGSTLVWYQKLGENGDEYPVLTPSNGNTVYNNYYTCGDKQVNIFSNTEANAHEKYDKHVKGTETLSANGLYSSTCQRCQTDFKYIKDFCGIKDNDLELTVDNGKYKAKAVTLTDGEAYNSPVDIEVKDLKYARTYAANKWQPLYVPFAMNVDQWTGKGLTVASINNFHETKLKSGETQVLLEVKKVTSGSLEPNIPYLILCDAEGEKLLELGATTLSKAEEGSIDCHSVTRNYVFQGKYTTKNDFGASETAIYYGVKDGEMVQLTAEDVIGPQNWYLTVSNRPNLYDVDTPLTSAAKAFSIRVIGDGEATGIEDIHVISDEGENGKQGIFDLQGRKLDAEPTHGIYIKNGKKYVK